ncbi:MAG: M28 family peptidase [Anaerolineae bacterium]|nr:M28 family metallopeptidase [Anaerolineae bacterium]MDW8103003.1 M28 family peptidase [Anaerolineae bacterium]
MSAMEHVRYLAENIGPRGSTTEKEIEAAHYAFKVLAQEGLNPALEPFSSARSAWHPYALFSFLALLSEILFFAIERWGALIAFVLTFISLISVLLELTFRPSPLRLLLPRGRSQNVVARIPPKGEVREKVVLMGHLDTHRTPLVFSSERWLKLFTVLVPLGLISALALTGLFLAGTFFPLPALKFASLPFALIILGIFLITLQADFTPYTPGANDNASGAGIVLNIASRLARSPLERTEVWVVLSGCEEVGCYGAEAFARAHKKELGRAIWLVLDSVGGKGAGPVYIVKETFLLTSRSDRELLALADKIASSYPELGAYSKSFRGAYTEGAIGVKHGFRVLTLVGLRRDGILPGWHRPADTVENLDPEVLEKTEKFVWELLREIDVRASGAPRS